MDCDTSNDRYELYNGNTTGSHVVLKKEVANLDLSYGLLQQIDWHSSLTLNTKLGKNVCCSIL